MNPLSSKETLHDPLCVVKEFTIQNRNGLHARPAAQFVKTANRFHAEIWVEKEGERVNGKSIMGLMMLAAAKGSHLRIIAEGEEASSAVAALGELIASYFGEEQEDSNNF